MGGGGAYEAAAPKDLKRWGGKKTNQNFLCC